MPKIRSCEAGISFRKDNQKKNWNLGVANKMGVGKKCSFLPNESLLQE